DGSAITATELYSGANMRDNKQGLYQLENADLFNLLVIAPYTATTDLAKSDWDAVTSYAHDRRAMVLIDPPANWTTASAVTASNITGVASRNDNAAMYFPRLEMGNPLRQNRIEAYPPSGAVAGVIARIDATRGVWKSAAGIEATLNGVLDFTVPLTDGENGRINPLGVNC